MREMIKKAKIVSVIEGEGIVPKGIISTAVIIVTKEGKEVKEAACGKNLFDALFKGFCRAIGKEINLIGYQITENSFKGNSKGEAKVRISLNGNEKEVKGEAENGRKAFMTALVTATNQQEGG
jgi:hypothetical protein